MSEDKTYCLWQTSDSEIDDEIEQMRKSGIDLPAQIEHEYVVHYYKKAMEWANQNWQVMLRDSIKLAAGSN